ncbi:hypothetical protein Bca52824_064594 [Brassica carinata]|uniref:Vesicle-fusing ATPase n=1 Tax=Brassica carinata TaxID=52824 RepID=A0A8X7QM95_BRACI|nr:hypothetical protein Bca52824_064594 [Brassica carinata]
MRDKAPKCESQNEPFGDVAVGEWEPCNFLDFFHATRESPAHRQTLASFSLAQTAISSPSSFPLPSVYRLKSVQSNLHQRGIGGLGAEFADIFRRAFASRVFPLHVTSRLGIKNVKGMLLFGPPGTGKTLMARQIGKMLNGKDPKIVNGPEVLSKFVGETEKNVRDLFADAEQDQRTLGKKKLFSLICVFFFYVCANEALLFYFPGDASELHVIIFDEIDAICKSRGSTRDGTGVHDSIVNQLLTKVSQRSWLLLIFVNSVFSRMWLPLLFQIDGVEALNNVLLIGMTNRKDLLDEALLRPGRLEVQVEISLPDEAGRFQILQIHTNKMKEISFLGHDFNLQELAARTKNYSGTELEGVVKSATSYALNRQLSMDDLTKPVEEKNIKITMEDFLHAIHEVQPAFGASTDDLDVAAMVNASEVKHEPAQCLFSLKLPNCKSMPLDTRQRDLPPQLALRITQLELSLSLSLGDHMQLSFRLAVCSHLHSSLFCGVIMIRSLVENGSQFRKPDSWKLNEIFATRIVLGGYQAVMSVIFFWVIHKTDFCSDKFGVRSIRDNNDELMFAVYPQVSNISQALIFVTRSRSWSFVERPGALLMIAFVIAQLIATLIAVYANWTFAKVKGIGWGWAAVIWVYSILTYIPQDILKFAIRYILSGKAWVSMFDKKSALTTRRDYGARERQAEWAREQRTQHGLQTRQEINVFPENEGYRELSQIVEQAKKRA